MRIGVELYLIRVASFISQQNIVLERLINTHCHIDHVFGNHFIEEEYGLLPEYNTLEQSELDRCEMVAGLYGLRYTPSKNAINLLSEEDSLLLGNNSFQLFFTPGHSPGSLSFYNEENKILISGDVLFQGSIGRTDLPGGDFGTLEKSIKNKLYKLPDDVIVYPGHGSTTTIGNEKKSNPFVKG
jgi:glyoxylase-like metal-dependent hydrolase (beta-lactamase superfamily II)